MRIINIFFNNNIEEKIILKVEGEEVIYPVSSLVYAEAANNCVRFVFTGGSIETRMKFSEAITLDRKSVV